jgi:hypothetical protein
MRLPTLVHRMVVAAPRSPVTHVVGSVLQLSAQMAQVMLIAHMFGASVVGIYGYSLALITPVVLLANWHVRHALVMDGSRRFAWSAYARLRGFSFLAAVPILVSGLLLPGLSGFAVLYLCLVFQRLTEMWFDLHYSVYQRSGEIGRIGIGVGTRGFLGVVAFMGVLIGTRNIAFAVLVQAVVSWCWWMICERPNLCRGRDQSGEMPTSESSSWKLFQHIWPLGVTVTLGSFMAVFPRIALAERHRLDEAGHFILLGYLFIPAILAQAALQQMVAPRLAEASATGDRAGLFHVVVRLSVLQFLLQMVIAIAVFFTQQAVGFSWLAPGFSLATSDLVWFTLSQCTAVVLNSLGLVMDADGRYREKLFFWSALTAIGIVLTWWLATQGIVGVSKAAVIVGICGGAFAAIWFRRSFSPKLSAKGLLP